MGGRGASSGSNTKLSSDFTKKVLKANQGNPEELIKELSKFKYQSDREEYAYGTNMLKYKSVVAKLGNDEVYVRFDSNYTGKEINNSAKEELYTVVSVYQKKDGKPFSHSYVYKKQTKSLKNIKANRDNGYELFEKITKSR